MTSRNRSLEVATGLALILVPLIAWGLKLVSMGWMIVLVIMGPILLLLAGYIVQIVIASQGFLSSKGLFGATTMRATIAAWLTSAGFLLLGIFMPDGGDSGYGSTLQVWLGVYGENSEAVHASTDTLTEVLALVSAAVWIVGFIWLLIEWIMALGARRRARRGLLAAA